MADLTETQKILEEIREYDLARIPRREELGQALSFEDAVEPSRRLQNFFNRIPAQHVDELSQNFRSLIDSNGLAFLNILGQIQDFDPSTNENPVASRANILAALNTSYDSTFNSLHAAVSFIAARQQDFSTLQKEARSAAEGAKRQAKELSAAMAVSQQEASGILGEIRKVAAEQGVSQQAHYFHNQANSHDNDAVNWQKYTVMTSIGLGVYALVSLVFSVLYDPKSSYQAVQIGMSKILIFAVIGFMLIHCSKILIASRHNAIINRHRENALLTYNALVAAGANDMTRDIVLNHAASCIFTPQDSGYNKGAGTGGGSSSPIIEILPKLATQSR